MISMLNVATILNVIQPPINTKTLHNTVLMFLMPNPGTEVTVQAIIISIPAVWFSKHTHKKNPNILHSFLSFNHQVHFLLCAHLHAATIDGSHTHPRWCRSWPAEVRPICESREWMANMNNCGGSRSIFHRFVVQLRCTRNVSHIHFDITD